MTTQERRAFIVIASVAVASFLVSPANSTIGVFIDPLIKAFGWNHAQASRIATSYLFAAGIAAPVVGWLLDRVPAQWVMATGAVSAGCALLVASRVNSLTPLVLLYAVIGVGVQASTLIPGIVVAVNWFKERRGFAMGTVFGISTAGLALAPAVYSRVVAGWGWRIAMIWLAIPMFVIALPLFLLLVRTRPESATGKSAREELAATPGLEVGAALRSASFWLLALMQIFFYLAFTGVFYELIPYLISLGYSSEAGARAFGFQALGAVIGFFGNGLLGDRIGARKVLFGSFIVDALAVLALSRVSDPHFGFALLVIFVMTFGTAASGATTMIPYMVANTLGIRRFGTLAGIILFIGSLTGAMSPVLAGWIFDATGSYRIVWELYAVGLFFGFLLSGVVHPVVGHDAVPSQAEAAVS